MLGLQLRNTVKRSFQPENSTKTDVERLNEKSVSKNETVSIACYVFFEVKCMNTKIKGLVLLSVVLVVACAMILTAPVAAANGTQDQIKDQTKDQLKDQTCTPDCIQDQIKDQLKDQTCSPDCLQDQTKLQTKLQLRDCL